MLEAKKKELQSQKDKFEKQSKSKKGSKDTQKEEDEVKQLEKQWEADKLQLSQHRDTLKEQCAQIQEAIKAKKNAA